MRTIIKIQYTDCKPKVDTLSKQQKENAQVIRSEYCRCSCAEQCLITIETIELLPF